MVKRHQRANPARPNAPVGVIEREGGIHVSNVAILDPKDKKPTRVGIDPRPSRAPACASPSAPGRSSTEHGTSEGQISQGDPAGADRALRLLVPMQAPRLLKITLNMGVGEAKQDSKMLEAAQEQLATIAGQKPNIRRAKKSSRSSSCARGCPSG